MFSFLGVESKGERWRRHYFPLLLERCSASSVVRRFGRSIVGTGTLPRKPRWLGQIRKPVDVSDKTIRDMDSTHTPNTLSCVCD